MERTEEMREILDRSSNPNDNPVELNAWSDMNLTG